MIACFENLVGIHPQCGEGSASDSGLYIQDLTYINLRLADAILTEQESGIALLRSLRDQAINYLVNDVRTRMMPYFKVASVIENSIVGYYPVVPRVIPGVAGTYKGIQLQIIQWPYIDVFLPSMTIWVDYTGTFDIEVWNLTTGKKIDTIPVTTVAGEQLVLPEMYKNYESGGQNLNLFIGYNTTGINSYQSNIYNSIIPFSYGNCRTCQNSWNYPFANRYAWIFSRSIAAAAQKTQNNLRSINDCGGLSITYTLNCSMTGWLCKMRNQMGFALLHMWGMKILDEVRMSTRLNSLVILKKDEREDLYSYFESNYKEAMSNLLRNLKLPNDVCFKCNNQILTGVATP